MILPITVYGNPILRKRAQEITPEYPALNALIENMFETMYKAEGVGLAAPQVNKSVRLIVVDATPFEEDEPELKDFKKAFINPEILTFEGDEEVFNEGCLSLPGMNEDVSRQPEIRLRYQDENFETREETYSGILARIIQHEYDHIDGILYVDRLPALKKMLLKGKLRDISEGKVDVEYRMIFPKTRKKVR